MRHKNISIIGLGHVGLPMATILSNIKKNGKKLYKINVIEKNDNKGNLIKKKINNKNFEINTNDNRFNQLVEKAFKKNIEIETDYRNINKSEIIIISVNFNIKKKEKNPFKPLKEIIINIGRNISKKTLILVETTLPPGTCSKVLIPELIKVLKKRKMSIKDIQFCYSYERVTPGKNYVNSIVNSKRCLAGYDKFSEQKCEKFLKTFINTKKYPLRKLKSLIDCEAAKILENTYRTINIAFIDEWTKYAELMKINLIDIISAIRERHTHSNIMNPGLGVGGYCLTKDPLFSEHSAKLFASKTLSFPITKKSIEINKRMPLHSIDFINKFCKIKSISKVLIYGLTYKEDVSDIRHSPAIKLFNILKNKTKNICCIDPLIQKENWKKFGVVKKVNFKKIDIIIMCVKHNQFKTIPLKKFRKNSIVFDLNNVLNLNQIKVLSKNKIRNYILGYK